MYFSLQRRKGRKWKSRKSSWRILGWVVGDSYCPNYPKGPPSEWWECSLRGSQHKANSGPNPPVYFLYCTRLLFYAVLHIRTSAWHVFMRGKEFSGWNLPELALWGCRRIVENRGKGGGGWWWYGGPRPSRRRSPPQFSVIHLLTPLLHCTFLYIPTNNCAL